MGKLIVEARKAKGFTQKELAVRLGVTDKAVSKWERGISCPDVGLILPLAELLEVSTSELLSGEKINAGSQTGESVIHQALAYFHRREKLETKKIRAYFFYGTTICVVLAMMICLICDFAINQNLSWSLIVAASLVGGWMVLIPLGRAREKVILKTLIALSLAVIPYLAALSYIINLPLVFSLGSCLAVIGLFGIWCVYGIFSKFYSRKYFAMGVVLLVMMLIDLGINYSLIFFLVEASESIASMLLNISVLFILALLCFGVDYVKRHPSQ